MFIFLQKFCQIFSQNNISQQWYGQHFEFTVLRLMENTFDSQKHESRHFYSYLTNKTLPPIVIITSQAEEN